MSEFKPLDASRAVRDDEALRGVDKAFLWAAVFRTNNKTRKVRASLGMLAKDAGFHPNTATNVFAEANEPVLRYFEKVERSTRQINLWFHPSTTLTAGVTVDSHSTCDSQPEEDTTLTVGVTVDDPFAIAEARLSQEMGMTLTGDGDDSHSRCEPSASLCSTSATTTSPFVRPSSLQGDEQAPGTETPSGPLTEEPPSDEGLAAEMVETLPCGCAAGTSCPECRGDAVKHSNLTPAKQKELDERWKIAEGVDPNTGTPVDRDRSSAGYRSRRRH